MSASIGAVFDLDGTLVDSAPAIMRVGNRLMADHDLAALSLDETRSFVGHGAARFVERAFGSRGVAVADLDGGVARAVDQFEQYYAEGDPRENAPFPGVEQALTSLRAKGVALSLCTNKPGLPTQHVLDGLGWSGLFEAVIAGDTLPQRKPDPAPLRAAVARLGRDRVVYVGDSEVDAETAARAGVPFLLFTEGYRRRPAEELQAAARFSDFEALETLITEHSGAMAR